MRLAAAALGLLALVWVAFAPALEAGILRFDDDQLLVLNARYRGLGKGELGWMLSTPHLGHYQPLTWVSFALDWSAAGELDPAALHRTNLWLHGGAALACLALAHALLRRALPGGGPTPLAAFAAAALFAVHPLRAESVAWITERRDVLSGPLFLLSLWAWVRWAAGRPAQVLGGREAWGAALAAGLALSAFFLGVELDPARAALAAGPALWLALLAAAASAALVARSGARSGARSASGAAWYALAWVAALLSMGAKAWGMVLPALLLVLDAYPLGRWRTRRDLLPLVVEKLPLAAPAIACAALARWAQASQGGTMKTLAEHTLAERALQAGYGLAWYPWKTLAPLGLSPLYELPDELRLGQARFLVPAVAVLALTGLLWACRRRWPALAAAWAAYTVIVAPVLGLLQSGPQLVADRYSYLACVPFALLAGGGWLWAMQRARSALLAGAAGAAVLVLALAGSTALTRAQVGHWRSDAALWEHALALEPASYGALLQLGNVRLAEGRVAEARELLERGFELEDDPRFLEALARCAERAAADEPARAAEHRARAVELCRQAYALALDTDRFVPAYRFNYGTALWNAGRPDEALLHLTWYAGVVPDDISGRVQLGAALAALGRHAQALEHLEAAVALDPASPDAARALAASRAALGASGRAH
jgi:tetratricopeptide (TPR) repeat protein